MEIKKPIDIDYVNESIESIVEKIEFAIEEQKGNYATVTARVMKQHVTGVIKWRNLKVPAMMQSLLLNKIY
mgnify:CR=1 FL=1